MPLNIRDWPWKFILITSGLILAWLVLLFIVGGYHYEDQKFKMYFLSIVLVLGFQFFVGDPIFFALWAAVASLIAKKKKKISINTDYDYIAHPVDTIEDRIEFLKLRLSSAKTRLSYFKQHHNEELNVKYKKISKDLFLYIRYFVLLVLVITSFWHNLPYHNTQLLKRILYQARLSDLEADDVYEIKDVYDYISETIIDGFQRGLSLDDKTLIPEPGWMPYEISKVIGVIRLMQKRSNDSHLGLKAPRYINEPFLPGWKLPYRKLHYLDKYWRTYEPWVVKKILTGHSMPDWLVFPELKGYMNDYLNDEGYVAMLARTHQNSKTVLKFLKDNKWLDGYTSALFIDFVVYNVDSNVFGLCTVLIERTPFGTVTLQAYVESHVLLVTLNQLSYWLIFLLLLYSLQMVQFIKVWFLTLWLSGKNAFANIWNLMDFFIIALNVLLFILVCLRSLLVANCIERIEAARKEEFLDIRGAAFLSHLCRLFAAFLVALATVRLWKILLFARVFRLFTRTLYLAAWPLFWSLLAISIFMVGFAICSYLMNASVQIFTRTPISLVTLISFSFGYGTQTYIDAHDETNLYDDLDPSGDNDDSDDNDRQSFVSLLLYFVMVFLVYLVFFNIMIALVCFYFFKACKELREEPQPTISFWHFLKMEYAPRFECFKNKCCRCRKTKPIGDNEKSEDTKLDDAKSADQENAIHIESTVSGSDGHQELPESYRVERVELLIDILKTQHELIDLLMGISDEANVRVKGEVKSNSKDKVKDSDSETSL